MRIEAKYAAGKFNTVVEMVLNLVGCSLINM